VSPPTPFFPEDKKRAILQHALTFKVLSVLRQTMDKVQKKEAVRNTIAKDIQKTRRLHSVSKLCEKFPKNLTQNIYGCNLIRTFQQNVSGYKTRENDKCSTEGKLLYKKIPFT
jgi:hypothetical protein